MNRISSSLILFLLSYSFYGMSQVYDDSLQEIEVTYKQKALTSNQKIEKTQIQLLQPLDAGDLVQKFAGVTLKSYGGIGGMKTISVRGIGGSHTSIVQDGFLIQNTQTGQIDLSNIQTESIEEISLSIGGINGSLLPIAAYLSGSSLQIQSFENRFSNKKLQIRSSLKGGSFGQLDSYLSLKYSRNRMYFSVFGKYKQAQGAYAFELQNGNHSYAGERHNSDLQEAFGGLGFGYRFNPKSVLKASYQVNVADKGLPGAVILYNPTAIQRLNNESHQLNVDYTFVSSRIGIRNYASFRYENLNYLDRGYLNNAGFLDQDFFNASVQHGVSFQSYNLLDTSKTKNIDSRLFGGVEQAYSELHSSIANFATPKRYELKGVLGIDFNWKKLHTILQLGGQAVFDQNELSHAAPNRYVFTPYFLLEANRELLFLGKPSIWAKRTFRVPTFNELYYNQIGNIHLKPEIANQLNAGTKYEFNFKRSKLQLDVAAYFNLVENKIVAIPTKNLFVWSMQNVGKAQVLGSDFQIIYTYNLNDWKMSTNLNYSYQMVQDLTNRTSPTYGHQLPYLPQHTGNIGASIQYKKMGISYSALLTSERFALNENILSNQIDGFVVHDASVFYRWDFQEKQKIRLSFTVKNFTNQSYAFVRYYVMPGANFLISLNYEFN
jgi:vitamin B12 transporter